MKEQRLKRLVTVAFLIIVATTVVIGGDLNEELFAAARKGDLEMVKSLLKRGADANAKTEYGATPLFFACDRGHLEVVRVLIEHGADVKVADKFYGMTPLVRAMGKDHGEVVKLLLEKGAPTKDLALLTASRDGYPNVVRSVLSIGGFEQKWLNNCLTLAARNNRSEIVEMLNKAGAVAAEEFKIDVDALNAYTGVFKSQEMEMALTIKDGKLIASLAGQSTSTLVPTGKHTFSLAQFPEVQVTFILLEDKRVVGLTFKGPQNETVFRKVEAK